MRRLLTKLLALVIGIVVACVVAESCVLILFGEQPKFPRRVVEAPWRLRYNEPGSRYRHKSADISVQFRINQQGMRADRDYTHEKEPGVKRIISLGDSFALGYESTFEDCFSSVLERALNKAGLRVEVLNAGVSGFSTAEEYLYLERELMKYDPDLVMVSFYENDLRDNVRTGLFRLEGEKLIEWEERYVPAGGLGNFLNTNPFFNILSERSNAFVFLKERATLAVKRRMVRQQQERAGAPKAVTSEAVAGEAVAGEAVPSEAVAGAAVTSEAVADGAAITAAPSHRSPVAERRARLVAAILDRMYQLLGTHDIPLLIHSIPFQKRHGGPLTGVFPLDMFDLDRPGLVFLASKELLESHVDSELLYWQRSSNHWTPFANELVGEAIARLILDRQLLQ